MSLDLFYAWHLGPNLVMHVKLVIFPKFCTLDRFHRSWQAVVVNLWDSIPGDILLRGESDGWRTVLKDIQQFMYL